MDLDDPALEPAGWDGVVKPPIESPEDIVLYELHVRDFSAGDPSVPDALKGPFKAVALPGTRGVRHLRALALAGVTHVHLLPSFDIASVDEDKTTWREPEGDLGSMPPDSEQQLHPGSELLAIQPVVCVFTEQGKALDQRELSWKQRLLLGKPVGEDDRIADLHIRECRSLALEVGEHPLVSR